jgi:hypothetical protein
MTKSFRTLAALAAGTAALAAATTASATPVTATLRVEDFESTLIPVTQGTTDDRVIDGHDAPASALTLIADVADRAHVPIECDWATFNGVTSCGLIGVAGVRYPFGAGLPYFRFVLNDVDASFGISDPRLTTGDRVAIIASPPYPEPAPPLLELTLSSDVLKTGTSFRAEVRSYDTTTGASTPAVGARIEYGAQVAFTDATGLATLVASTAGTATAKAYLQNATRSGAVNVCSYTTAASECTNPTPSTPSSPAPTPTAPIPSTPTLADSVPPASRITAPRLFSKARRVVRIGGAVAPDRSDVASVQYALAKLSGTQCRFRQADGKLGPLGACTTRTWLPARGGAFWTVALHAALAPGRYRVWSRATDGAGNQERSFVTGSSSGNFTVVK